MAPEHGALHKRGPDNWNRLLGGDFTTVETPRNTTLHEYVDIRRRDPFTL